MASYEVSADIKRIIGGMFHQDIDIMFDSLDEVILDDIEAFRPQDLKRLIDFCDELLKPKYHHGARNRFWLEAGAQFGFKPAGLVAVLEFMRANYRDELARRQRSKPKAPRRRHHKG